MEITQLTDKENAEFEAKATELAKKYGVTKVHVYVGIDSETDERIVGYIKEPSYIQKIFTLDKIATGGMFAAADSLLANKTYDEQLKILQDTIEQSQNNQQIIEFQHKENYITNNQSPK